MVWHCVRSGWQALALETMGTGTLVHSFGSMYLSPMIISKGSAWQLASCMQNACSYVNNNDILQSFLRKIAFCSQILLKLMQIIIKSADI